MATLRNHYSNFWSWQKKEGLLTNISFYHLMKQNRILLIARFSRDHCNLYLFIVDCFDCVIGTFSFFTQFALKYQKLLIYTSVTIKPSHYHFKHPNYSIRRTLICQKLTHTFTSFLGPSNLLIILYYIYLKLVQFT